MNNKINNNKGLLEECSKEEHVEVTGAAATSCLKRKLCHVFPQSPPGRRHNNKYPVNSSHRFRFA
jgi:hypothetical protein